MPAVKGPQTEAEWRAFDRGEWPPKKPTVKREPVKKAVKKTPAKKTPKQPASKAVKPVKSPGLATSGPVSKPASARVLLDELDDMIGLDAFDSVDDLDDLDDLDEPDASGVVEPPDPPSDEDPPVGLRGSETPRIFTPPRRELTEETTDGYAAIQFAEEILCMNLFPWQKWLLIHALELNEDFTYRFRTVIMEAARQNGKTTIMIIMALWHIYCKGSRTVIATAQDLSKAEDAWNAAVEMAQEDEELNELIRKISLAHPKLLKVLNPITNKTCSYRVAAKARGAGRGFSGDLVLLDELREHHTFDSWAAVTKTQMARPRAQAWAFTNAGDAMSVVWRYQRALAHKDLNWPDGDGDADVLGVIDPEIAELFAQLEKEMGQDFGTGWFEWSAPPNAKRTDRNAWAQANGSMNHTDVVEDCVTERAIAHALHTDPVAVFDQEVMCRYVPFADGGPFPDGKWRDTCKDEASSTVSADAKSMVCVEVSTTRSAAVIVKSAKNVDDIPVVGVIKMEPGTDWVVNWLLEERSSFAGVVVRAGAGSPVLSLLQQLIDAGLPVTEWKGGEIGAAFGQLYDAVRDEKIMHLTHATLDAAACSALIKTQTAGGWIVDPVNSPSDVAPLYGVAGAVWGLQFIPDTGPSMYSGEHGASVLAF